jgi:hypothetical protein
MRLDERSDESRDVSVPNQNAGRIVATTGTIVPGVIYLGAETGTTAEQVLLDRGNSSGVDAVLIFYVEVKSKSRSSGPSSTTKLAVHNLKNGEKHETSTLNSQTVAKARERDNDDDNDPVELQLDKIFTNYSDEKLRFSDMPDLKPEIAKKRVDSLVASSHPNPLPVVAEILAYHKAGLIDEPTAVAALAQLIDGEDEAKKLISGSAEEKLAAIEKWLPGKFDDPAKTQSQFR